MDDEDAPRALLVVDEPGHVELVVNTMADAPVPFLRTTKKRRASSPSPARTNDGTNERTSALWQKTIFLLLFFFSPEKGDILWGQVVEPPTAEEWERNEIPARLRFPPRSTKRTLGCSLSLSLSREKGLERTFRKNSSRSCAGGRCASTTTTTTTTRPPRSCSPNASFLDLDASRDPFPSSITEAPLGRPRGVIAEAALCRVRVASLSDGGGRLSRDVARLAVEEMSLSRVAARSFVSKSDFLQVGSRRARRALRFALVPEMYIQTVCLSQVTLGHALADVSSRAWLMRRWARLCDQESSEEERGDWRQAREALRRRALSSSPDAAPVRGAALRHRLFALGWRLRRSVLLEDGRVSGAQIPKSRISPGPRTSGPTHSRCLAGRPRRRRAL